MADEDLAGSDFASTMRHPVRQLLGMCAELLPELIELDDWGYPIVHSTVPKHIVPLARRAVDVCPVLALRLRSGR